MDKEELNAKLGYDMELLNRLSNAFDLQEDYNDYGWDKLFEICRYIYNLEQRCRKQKEIINKIEEKIKENIKNAEYDIIALTITDREYYKYVDDMLNDLLQILENKEVSE